MDEYLLNLIFNIVNIQRKLQNCKSLNYYFEAIYTANPNLTHALVVKFFNTRNCPKM